MNTEAGAHPSRTRRGVGSLSLPQFMSVVCLVSCQVALQNTHDLSDVIFEPSKSSTTRREWKARPEEPKKQGKQRSQVPKCQNAKTAKPKEPKWKESQKKLGQPKPKTARMKAQKAKLTTNVGPRGQNERATRTKSPK